MYLNSKCKYTIVFIVGFISRNGDFRRKRKGKYLIEQLELSISYYNEDIPIVGLPGCVMYAKRTIFDLALPRLLSDDFITAEELALLGEGGLCLNCPVCTYPNCGFGKGW